MTGELCVASNAYPLLSVFQLWALLQNSTSKHFVLKEMSCHDWRTLCSIKCLSSSVCVSVMGLTPEQYIKTLCFKRNVMS